MAVGKYLSLEEARRTGRLNLFAKQHPCKANHMFWPVLDSMIKDSRGR